MTSLLGGGREKGAKGDIISPRLAGQQGQMPTIMTGDTNAGALPEQRSRLLHRYVGLTDMSPISASLLGQVWTVIDQQGRAKFMTQGPQFFCRRQDCLLIRVFQPQLQDGNLSRRSCPGLRLLSRRAGIVHGTAAAIGRPAQTLRGRSDGSLRPAGQKQ